VETFGDTSADAHRVQIEAYRRMGGAGRVAAMFRLNERARNLAMAGIRHRHPEYDETRQRLAFARLVLGDELVRKVWPDRDLVEP
jgi:predicted ArsR family transcriptional regulator